jgi:hypothetical protein
VKVLTGILVFVGCRALLAVAVLLAFAWFVGEAFASHEFTDIAEEIVLPDDFIAYRNVAEAGDLLVFGPYNLPHDDDPEAADPIWSHWGTSGVLARLIFVAPPALQDRVPPDLGWNLIAFYLTPGHGASWGSASLFVRMQGNPAFFANVNAVERAISYSASGADSAALVQDSETRQAALCDVFEDQLQAIEQADSDVEAGDLVDGGLITTAGTEMVMAAFSGAASLMPACLIAGVQGSGVEFDPSEPALRDGLVTEVEGTDWWARWEAVATEYGFDAVFGGAILSVGIAGFVMVMMTVFSGSPVIGTASGLGIFMAMGLWFPHTILQVVWVLAAIFGLLGLAFFAGRLPR